jgi:hypothetical protein
LNEYSKNEIRQALHAKQKPLSKGEKPNGTAMLSCQQAITNKISRILAKYNIRNTYIPQTKNIHMLRPAKDDMGLKIPGIYQIPRESSEVYTRL